jgi:hypothetical protein
MASRATNALNLATIAFEQPYGIAEARVHDLELLIQRTRPLCGCACPWQSTQGMITFLAGTSIAVH